MQGFAQQKAQPYFLNFSTEDGLPSPEVHAIFQDSKGFIWIGTDNGAVRFDGSTFKTFSAADGLTQNVVFEIKEDSKKRVWLSTMRGETFIVQNDTIVEYPYNDKILQHKNQYALAKLKYLDQSDNAYFELETYGFLKIDTLGNTSTYSYPPSKLLLDYMMRVDDKILRSSYFPLPEWKIASDSSTTSEKYYFLLSQKEGEAPQKIYSNLQKHELSLRVEHTETLLKNSNKNILLFYNGYLVSINDGQILWEKPAPKRIFHILESSKGEIIFGADKDEGILYFQNEAAVRANDYQQFLKGSTVYTSFEDKAGGLWVGTRDDGVYYSPNLSTQIFNKDFGFPDDNISCIEFSSDTTMYLGTASGLTYSIDFKNQLLLDVVEHAASLGRYAHDLLFQEGILYTSSGFIVDGEFVTYDNRFRKNSTLLLGVKKLLWRENHIVGLLSDFVVYFMPQTGVLFDKKYDFFDRHQKTFTIYVDKQGRLLGGTEEGLIEFVRDKGKVKITDKPQLQTRIDDIAQLSDSTFVLATKGKGIFLWKDTLIQNFSTTNGLVSNMVENIHINNDTIWVGTFNGLSRIAPQSGSIRTFDVSSGLPSNDINDINSHNGQLWVATSKGLVKFREYSKNQFSIPPVFNQIKLGNRPYVPSENIEVDYINNNVVIDYVSFDYKQKGGISYRYRLQKSNAWNYTESKQALFTDLPPNTYQFEVQSKNEDGIWSESLEQTFTINPPWYQTWWAITLGVLTLMTFMLWLIYRERKKSLRKIAQQKRESAMQAQIIELERAALNAQMNPHFLFNCLNSIQNFILENDSQNAVKFLGKFAHLTRRVLNLSIEGKVSIQQEILLLQDYLALEKLRFKDQFDYTIQIDPKLDKENIEIPPLLVQPFVENAIIHGMASREKGGKIDISFTQKNDILLIVVGDNGLNKIESRNPQKNKHEFRSVGMNITQRRLKLINDFQDQDSISIQQKMNAAAKVNTTEVSIAIKI